MAVIIRGSLIIALVGVLVSGAVALAVSETKIGVINEDLSQCRQSIDRNQDDIGDIQQSLSGIERDMVWVVNTLDRIDRRLEGQE
jgi:hypothetical protein